MKKILMVFLSLCCAISLLSGCEDVNVAQTNSNTPINQEERWEENIAEDTAKSEDAAQSIPAAPNSVSTVENGRIKVHFLDVGQGDCEFIELPNGQTMLIDAGTYDSGAEIIKYIKGLNYNKIDYVVATHPHSDHIGSMAKVLDTFKIGTMYMPEKTHTSKTFERMLDAIENNDIDLHKAKSGVNVLSSGNLAVDILAPFSENQSNLNNYSAVVKISYGETSFLFMGDAEHEVEQRLTGSYIASDVLKVGHHGSDTASGKSFIEAVSPKYAIISCGHGNSYGHPHKGALENLNKYNVNIYRTDEVGTIVVEADDKKNISIDKKASGVKENAPPEDTKTPVVSAQEKIQDENNASVEVYKTKTGECYHLSGCSSLSRSKIPTTVKNAKDEGLRPCQRCNPPE